MSFKERLPLERPSGWFHLETRGYNTRLDDFTGLVIQFLDNVLVSPFLVKLLKNLQHVVASEVLQWRLSNCCNAVTAQARKNKGVQATNQGTYRILASTTL